MPGQTKAETGVQPPEVRRLKDTANTIESFNRQLRRKATNPYTYAPIPYP